MEKQTPDQVRRLQSHFFGQRYAGAHLGSIKLNHEHGMRFNAWLKAGKGLLLLSGNPGCGKTYLCAATVSWMYGKVRDIYATSETDFISKVKLSFDMRGDSDDEVRYLIDHEFYIYDDLGSTGRGKNEDGDISWKQKVWFIMLDERVSSQKPTVITTNFTRVELRNNLGSRSYSRLFSQENCVIEMFDYPDLRLPLPWKEEEAKEK